MRSLLAVPVHCHSLGHEAEVRADVRRHIGDGRKRDGLLLITCGAERATPTAVSLLDGPDGSEAHERVRQHRARVKPT